ALAGLGGDAGLAGETGLCADAGLAGDAGDGAELALAGLWGLVGEPADWAVSAVVAEPALSEVGSVARGSACGVVARSLALARSVPTGCSTAGVGASSALALTMPAAEAPMTPSAPVMIQVVLVRAAMSCSSRVCRHVGGPATPYTTARG